MEISSVGMGNEMQQSIKAVSNAATKAVDDEIETASRLMASSLQQQVAGQASDMAAKAAECMINLTA